MLKSLLLESDIESISIRRPSMPDDLHLPAYDNTKLQAINTCPTWGVLRYSLHKRMSALKGREMALEMGQAAHDVFAAVRLWQLAEYQHERELFDYHGPRLFGVDRHDAALRDISPEQDARQRALAYALGILDSSGYFDDPSDRRRTFSNLEEACIAYVDRWDFNRHPVWVRSSNDPTSDVGIELPIDVVLDYLLKDGTRVSIRFVGRCDGLHVDRSGDLVLHENKTASRLDDAWRMSFAMSSQITGYMLALPVSLGITDVIRKADVFGMMVPLPKTYDYGGIVREPVTRAEHHFHRWLLWVLHTVSIDLFYKDRIVEAPRYTHSCNRYFRPCQFIPFCDASEEEQQQMLSEMADDEWSPLSEGD